MRGERRHAVAVVVLALLLPSAGLSQSFTSDKRLLQSEGILRGSPRLMGLSGAYVGIAEGAEGQTRNPAAVAHKDPHFENDFTVDFAGTMHFQFFGTAQTQDWDNDGTVDLTAFSTGQIENSQVFYSMASVQYGRVGAGIGFDLQNFQGTYENRDIANVSLLHLFGSLGVSLGDDAVLVGVGVESSHAGATYTPNRDVNATAVRSYHGFGYQFGALYRPKDENYRVGIAFKPQTDAEAKGSAETIGPLSTFSSAVTPARLSLGGSYAVGSGGRALNIASRAGLIETGELDENQLPLFSAAMTKWLFSAQLDVFFPVENAVTVSAFLAQQGGSPPALPAGDRVTFAPRLGLEKELWPDRFRLRAGGYLEPAMVETGALRPHVTFGFEVYLFKLGPQRLSFGISFDYARRYSNLSFAVAVWK